MGYDYQDTDDGDPDERSAELQCQMIDAARELMAEHNWSFEDVESTLKATVGR